MDEMPREVLEARLQLDERLHELIQSGDVALAMQAIEQVRQDLVVMARAARKHTSAPAPHVTRCETRRAHAEGLGANVHLLADQVERRKARAMERGL